MLKTIDGKGLGWRRDLPDYRDYTSETSEIKKTLKEGGALRSDEAAPPSTVDLRQWCPSVDDQKQLSSCTAHACAALVEYFENKDDSTYVEVSRLFLYKSTRNLIHETGDTGAYLRETLKALVLFGVPPEEYWPYTDQDLDFDIEPPAFCYSFGQRYHVMKYYRLDPPATPKDVLLDRIKTTLATQLPAVFGFTVYSSVRQAGNDGKIPIPCLKERSLGGQAVVAVGYDDDMKIKNACNWETTGALLFQNSWGSEWGDSGYGWLPYEYVLKGLAVDWWSVVHAEWINLGTFIL